MCTKGTVVSTTQRVWLLNNKGNSRLKHFQGIKLMMKSECTNLLENAIVLQTSVANVGYILLSMTIKSASWETCTGQLARATQFNRRSLIKYVLRKPQTLVPTVPYLIHLQCGGWANRVNANSGYCAQYIAEFLSITWSVVAHHIRVQLLPSVPETPRWTSLA